MIMNGTITVKAFDFRRELKYSWPARLIAREGDWIILCGDWERPLRYAGGETTPVTNRSLEFYRLNRPYVIAAIFDENWELREYYGRVTLPPELHESEQELTFVMLGLDLQVKPDYDYDYDYEILEVERGEREGEEEREQAERGLIELVGLVERREGPFDREFLGRHLIHARRGSSDGPQNWTNGQTV
jgi:protein associated with RNAse G/E